MARLKSSIKISSCWINTTFKEEMINVVSYITLDGTHTQNEKLAANFGLDVSQSIVDIDLFTKKHSPKYQRNNDGNWEYGNEQIEVAFWF